MKPLNFPAMWARFYEPKTPAKRIDDEPLLRSELFSAAQIEQHGKTLAGLHALSLASLPEQLLARLRENEKVLYDVRNLLSKAVLDNRRITPAGEWLIDNFYLIEEQIRTAKRHLPKGYSTGLPRLAKGSSQGLPRVYDIALETISHGDGRIDLESLSSFVTAYQSITELKLGELWAIPIMLRLALIENLRRVSKRIAADRIDRNHADYWADQMTDIATQNPKDLILVIADMARSSPPMVSAFVAEFTRRLQGQGPALALPLTWIEQQLAASSLTVEQLVQSENQQQAADQLSMSNSIGSLRFLGAIDWRKFVESLSVIERILGNDPQGVYGQMNFATRDQYRRSIEKIAKRSRLSESEVAQAALRLAQKGLHAHGADHVGFYLIGKGKPELRHITGLHLSPVEMLQQVVYRFPLPFYLGSMGLFTVILTAYLYNEAQAQNLQGAVLGVIVILSLFSMSQLALALANFITTLMVTPQALPRMDFSKGIPPESCALVIVPTLLSDEKQVEQLLEALEVRFLANRDPHLLFGLLTDFCDAITEHLPQDAPLLAQVEQGINALNAKYPTPTGDTFFLFHRPRRLNPQEGRWMGYERKRGKLEALNALLRGGSREPFSRIVGQHTRFAQIKYVITLDTDTQLPRDAARQLVATMAHPLNTPHYDAHKQRIVGGYGILQPQVAVPLSSTNRSRYARMWGNNKGIDPYTRVVSDVYQDLFEEGSFIGKGIYAVDAFSQVLKDRFPENRILSHDLLEGCYARAGLLSDIKLYEEYPTTYQADVSRRHRWIRGDWQLLSWILPWVPDSQHHSQPNPLSLLSRWKIFDNLRRSLSPLAITLLLLLTWTQLAQPGFWTVAVLAIFLIPPLISALLEFLQKSSDVLLGQHLRMALHTSRRSLEQILFVFICLPYEAFFSTDAIVRTLWRIGVVKKRLLEWVPSASTSTSQRHNRWQDAYRRQWISPSLALITTFYLALYKPMSLSIALPILLLWSLSPLITWWISQPLPRREAKLQAEQILFLRRIVRKTWAFFETFMGPEDNWLPPDNYQEYPLAKIAHRTSPTNIGLALLANLSAWDFAYLSTGQLLDRTQKTFDTLHTLERYQGHFYNWYDTQSCQPLLPIYISTVDSGNLAAHLLTLRAGFLMIPDTPICGPQIFTGLSDTLQVLAETMGDKAPAWLAQAKTELERLCNEQPNTLHNIQTGLEQLAAIAWAGSPAFEVAPDSPGAHWANAFTHHCQALHDDIVLLCPWTRLSLTPPILLHFPELDTIPTLRTLLKLGAALEPAISVQSSLNPEDYLHLEGLSKALLESSLQAQARIITLEQLAHQASDFANMDYAFLYDEERKLLTIGYNVSESRLDTSYYDLLASEARLATFVAIAQGQLPQDSWFALGRLLTSAAGDPVLLSWSGSMFEYLMPLLVMPNYEQTLLDETYKASVSSQIAYGHKRGVPWGISESGYNTTDAHLNYQYNAFGVPGLGLKRLQAGDLVIAPYASALALMVAPEEACLNLEHLAAQGFEGQYGFYEAIDYTASRLPRGHTNAIVRSFMAHHQGMSLLALEALLLDWPMQKRFMADPSFQTIMLLLQERIPKATALYSHTTELSEAPTMAHNTEALPIRIYTNPHTPIPEVQLLSNGRYHVMVTHAGGGYSRWKDLAVTRWYEDGTQDNRGSFCYIRDLDSPVFWSTTYQPTLTSASHYEAIFSDGRAEFRRHDHGLDTYTEIAVSPEDDLELRRITLTNRSKNTRTFEVTSYAEVVLASAGQDASHPAFSNLFVQTEILRQQQAILCTRRPRSMDEPTPWMFHLMAVHGAETGTVSYESDRMRFIGRGKTLVNPHAMGQALSNSEGSVLDPIVAIRHCITLAPGKAATINIVTGMSDTREACLGLVEKYQDRHLADRVFELAWTHSQVQLRQINATDSEAQVYGRLAASVLYANAALRANGSILSSNQRGQSSLWGYSISGDLPIVLVQIEDPAHIYLVQQLIQAHTYWRLKGLAVDLVIWNEDHAGYRQLLHDQIMALITAGTDAHITDRPGGIFIRASDQISAEDRILFQAVARIILLGRRGTLNEQLSRRSRSEETLPPLLPIRSKRSESLPIPAQPRPDLIFANGLGGFTPDGREYVISTARGQMTPAPWVNVLANAHFGTVVSENGLAYTWSENAHSFRLTPWYNDPVSDTSGEAFYLRDEVQGIFWSPMPMPSQGSTPYVTRHGFGYSVFEHTEHGISTEVWVYVALDAAVKFTVIKVRNQSGRTRHLSATGYVEWVLGDLRAKSLMHIGTEINPLSGAVFARNPYNTEFGSRTAFFNVDDAHRTVSGDRSEFLGRNGTLANPAAMGRSRLSGRVGTAFDPCAALQVAFELADGEERELVFTLGAGPDPEQTGLLAHQFRTAKAARQALEAVWHYWKNTLGTVQIDTPDPAVNILANGWLMYQTLACRLWARSGYYQSGGAFGFRDQLQDVMALLHAEPTLVREHLLRCATRQFPEGDVQHWWHPPSGRGVRTHCSDDYLWLPLATCRYVVTTGDTGILNEVLPFIKGRPVNAEEDSYYDLPIRSEETASLYDHCVRAITKGLTWGEHGLPLIGSGDWNDGMDMVGKDGKGESIWLGFFLYKVLNDFIPIAQQQGDRAFAERCAKEAADLSQNIEQHGWDGEWYLRAYFDDGTPLGSTVNPECRIDAIAQSWSVLSGAGSPPRSQMAMAALDRYLVRREDRIVQLLAPPFDTSALNPGYIKGYVPGVRENGGQYTHSAIWATMAFAALGDSQRAWELLNMINPIKHGHSAAEIATYKVEPYVVAADVYAVAPHTGRGGWTWYTGSAGWMYRLIIESLLGLTRVDDRLYLKPCIPKDWDGFTMRYWYQETLYHLEVVQGSPTPGIVLDGVLQTQPWITLVNDQQEHVAELTLPMPH